MSVGTSTPQLPEGRYGRTGDREADRRLKAVGAACAVVLLLVVGWFGASYLLRETKMNGLVPTFQAVSDSEMQINLQVSKSDGTAGTCTVRSQSADGAVVGLSDFQVPAAGTSYQALLTLRTTARGTTAQLLGCTPAK
ncbi:DUF4307 domain-containing protein [Kitasatospora sp. NPDC057223]|uniref:DUF4307 domain-containing protein n=1 Tax=Kitasatospora sp. NPDC057223 TaxID=3346055 RepID=UPI0036389C1D